MTVEDLVVALLRYVDARIEMQFSDNPSFSPISYRVMDGIQEGVLRIAQELDRKDHD